MVLIISYLETCIDLPEIAFIFLFAIPNITRIIFSVDCF